MCENQLSDQELDAMLGPELDEQRTKSEEVFNRLLENFRKDAAAAVHEAVTAIHGDLLPYINEDADANATFRAVGLVNKIIAGDYKLDESGQMICDGWRLRLTSCHHDKLTQAIAAVKGDEAKDKLIEMQKQRIDELVGFLNDQMGF